MVYNIVLAPLQHLQGLSKLLSEIFHLIIPVCFLFYWFTFKPKQNIEWQKAIPWLIYPSLYFIYTLIHGSISNFYPYPFINANKLGIARATINGLITIFTFFLLSLVLTGIGNYVSKKVSTVDE